ncbi:hypothetical protein Tco_1251295 [Tanacetum coccineum]
MIAGHDENQGEPHEEPVKSQPPSNASVPSTSQPTTEPHPDQELEIETELHGSSSNFVHTPPTQVATPSPEPENEPTEHTFDQPSTEHQPLSPRQEPEALQSQYPSHPHVPEARSLTAEDLLHMVPTLITKVDRLETELKQTKQTMGKAIVKLVKKVKKLENILKRRNVVLTTLEDEELEDQGRIFKEIDNDPLVSFVTPTKPSGEAQEEEISPTTLEAAKTLSNVASQRSKPVDKGKRYKRRKEFKGKDFEDISTGFEEVNTSGLVNTGGLGFSTAPKRTKEQIQQEEASLAEAIRLQNLEEEEIAKQVHLDALLAKRLAEEEELTEQQKQRKAQVQFEAQFYTKEDWDAIRSKLEANAELTKDVLGKDLSKQLMLRIMPRKCHGGQFLNLRCCSFEELKVQFEKTIRSIENFILMDSEKEKESLKRSGETLQSAEKKKQKVLDVEDIPISESAKFVERRSLLETRFDEEAVFMFVFPEDVTGSVNLTLLSLFFGVTATNLSLELLMLGQAIVGNPSYRDPKSISMAEMSPRSSKDKIKGMGFALDSPAQQQDTSFFALSKKHKAECPDLRL